ncbi:ABC transporter permease [Plantactinospora soyae]|uniref:ABC-type nitrate/sulfonate/bicarbonate transport system permease component n=1 Tax=Plantactinospora soyae TaxID=1544732 RepID=A0A927MDI6_9ACTN|nr:ABC transporter permease [Plantactinospora soyae]MBE1491126.1 ABC-type nitrate/sulfonate/bicarbonate transport system permease component [Plantactinospora soyae]
MTPTATVPPPAATAPVSTGRSGGTGPRGGNALLGLLGFATFLALLEVVPRTGLVSANYLPPTSRIAGALAELLGEGRFWVAVTDTLQGWFLGLAIAVALGVVVGFVIGTVPVLREFTASTIEFLRPIPSVALIPLAVLLFGSELNSVLLLVVYAAFWQVLVQVLYGVRDVDPVARDTAYTFGFSRWTRIRHLLWPTALPYLLTGIRLAAAVALILAITAELIIGAPGLGNEINRAQSGGAVDSMYALIIVTGLLGVAVNVLARRLERAVLSWHPSVRGEESP